MHKVGPEVGEKVAKKCEAFAGAYWYGNVCKTGKPVKVSGFYYSANCDFGIAIVKVRMAMQKNCLILINLLCKYFFKCIDD